MTVEELRDKLDTLIKGLPSSGFDSVADTVVADLSTYTSQAGELGMNSGKKLIENLGEALKTRKTGGNTDESVTVRVTALDFYVKNLQSGNTEDL